MWPEDGLEPQGRINGSVLGEMTILSENQLRDISRSTSLLVTSVKSGDSDSVLHVQQLLNATLNTAHVTSLSSAHGAAAIGSLCGLFDRCSTSQNQALRSLVLDENVWRKGLDIYLNRSENNKSKPLRRLLLTLALLLNRQENHHVKDVLITEAVSTCVNSLCKPYDSVSVKPAIQFLEHFMIQQFLTVSEIIALTPFYSPLSDRKTISEISTPESEIKIKAQAFIREVLEWIQYPDCAPAISRFLPVFVNSFKTHHARHSYAVAESEEEELLWMDPVKHFLEDHPTLYEAVENYLLPALLSLDRNTMQTFLDTLPLYSIQNRQSGLYSEVEILLCLLTARIGSKLKFGAEDLLSEY